MSDPLQPLDVAHQAPLIHGLFQGRILEWLPFHPSGDFPDAGIKPASLVSPALRADALPAEP